MPKATPSTLEANVTEGKFEWKEMVALMYSS